MELSGALSNPVETNKGLLNRLLERRPDYVEASETDSLVPKVAPRRPAALLVTTELVLRREVRPMRVAEIRQAVSALLERELHPSSLKQALSANLHSRNPRFRRISRGLYDLTNNR